MIKIQKNRHSLLFKTAVLFAFICITSVMMGGCSKKEDLKDATTEKDNSIEYAYHSSSIDLAKYDGLEYSAYQDTVNSDRVDEYINNLLSYQYGTNEDGEQMYTVDNMTDAVVSEILGEVTTVDDYRKKVEQEIRDEDKKYYDEYVPKELFERVVTLSNAKEFDEEKIKEYKEYLDNFYRQYASDFGMEWDTFRLESMGCETDEDYDSYLTEEAQENVKREMVIDTICKEEGIGITEEDKTELLERFVRMGYGENADEVKELLTDEEIITNAKYYKVMDLIVERAKEK